MSRHRDVRNMDYTEDYDGYDDIYGHSVDDDYYISPSNRQFLFNRDNSRDQPKIGEFIRTEQDIQEEDESEVAIDLSDLDKAKLESCIEQIKATLGALNFSRNELVNIIVSNNYNMEKSINAILSDLQNVPVEKKEKDVTKSTSKFFIPKLNSLNPNLNSFTGNSDKSSVKHFDIPSIDKLTSGINSTQSKAFTIPKISNFSSDKPGCLINADKKFNSLSDLVSSHLSKSLKTNLILSDADKISKVTHNMDNLKIVQPATSKVDLSLSQYQIDLSVALKSSPSSAQSLHNRNKHDLKEEKFEIPFVDCDVETETKTVLISTFDVKDTLNDYISNVKSVSHFGKVLCQKYRKRFRLKVKHCDTTRRQLPKFNFSTPSPDDSIGKHLRI